MSRRLYGYVFQDPSTANFVFNTVIKKTVPTTREPIGGENIVVCSQQMMEQSRSSYIYGRPIAAIPIAGMQRTGRDRCISFCIEGPMGIVWVKEWMRYKLKAVDGATHTVLYRGKRERFGMEWDIYNFNYKHKTIINAYDPNSEELAWQEKVRKVERSEDRYKITMESGRVIFEEQDDLYRYYPYWYALK